MPSIKPVLPKLPDSTGEGIQLFFAGVFQAKTVKDNSPGGFLTLLLSAGDYKKQSKDKAKGKAQ